MAKTSYMSRHLVYFFIKQVLGNDIEWAFGKVYNGSEMSFLRVDIKITMRVWIFLSCDILVRTYPQLGM